jgi:hypothetical protein
VTPVPTDPMHYQLRTLLIAMTIGPPLLAAVWLYSKLTLLALLVLGGYLAYLFLFVTIVYTLENTETEK